MCGIAGMVTGAGGAADRDIVSAMCECLRHRGPDGEGLHVTGQVGLGQRLLRVIDLDTGDQPMSNEDGTIWVTYNGEIYNFQQIRRDLELTGHRFATRSDTEVIVHAYEEDGVACLQRFRGMFAFALWNSIRRTLLLARDRFGKKPLFYTRVENQLLFASELQALLAHPRVGRDIDFSSLDDYLTYGYIPAPRTAFAGIAKLPPGHYLEVDCRGEHVGVGRATRYWQLAYEPKLPLSESEAAHELLHLLGEAVRLRLISEVPLGALLSGGIDSSLVVALMSRFSDRPVKTFSIGFEEQSFNELPYARAVAERYGTDHHELIVRPDALAILPDLVRHYGEPFADSSAIPTYYVSRLTREHVTVALNGDGGDEGFAGYERYVAGVLAARYRHFPAPLRHTCVATLAALIPQALPAGNRLRQVKGLVQRAELPLAQRHLGWLTYFTLEQKAALYTPAFQQELAGYRAEAWFMRLGEPIVDMYGESLDAALALDVASYLPYDLLVKMDIASMANSLETRSPFLDQEVMAFAARLPDRYKVHGLSPKYLLRRIGKDLLPLEVMNRRKMGFGVPVGRWLRRELRPMLDEVLLSPEACGRGYFHRPHLEAMVRAHLDGSADHSYQLWALLWLELWHRICRAPGPGVEGGLPRLATV